MCGDAVKRAIAALVFVVASACGGIAHRDREVDVDAGEDSSRPDSGRTPCIARRRIVGDEAIACRFHGDCTGAETCQGGVCCAGEVRDGKCLCGAAAGCDPQHICCQPAGETTPRCVADLAACGAR